MFQIKKDKLKKFSKICKRSGCLFNKLDPVSRKNDWITKLNIFNNFYLKICELINKFVLRTAATVYFFKFNDWYVFEYSGKYMNWEN